MTILTHINQFYLSTVVNDYPCTSSSSNNTYSTLIAHSSCKLIVFNNSLMTEIYESIILLVIMSECEIQFLILCEQIKGVLKSSSEKNI
jgi:hypothetical protein